MAYFRFGSRNVQDESGASCRSKKVIRLQKTNEVISKRYKTNLKGLTQGKGANLSLKKNYDCNKLKYIKDIRIYQFILILKNEQTH